MSPLAEFENLKPKLSQLFGLMRNPRGNQGSKEVTKRLPNILFSSTRQNHTSLTFLWSVRRFLHISQGGCSSH